MRILRAAFHPSYLLTLLLCLKISRHERNSNCHYFARSSQMLFELICMTDFVKMGSGLLACPMQHKSHCKWQLNVLWFLLLLEYHHFIQSLYLSLTWARASAVHLPPAQGHA